MLPRSGIQALLQNKVVKLNALKKRACRTILGHDKTCYGDALSACQFDSLDFRRTAQCFKFASGLADNIRTKHLLPPTRFEAHGRQLRNANSVSQLRFRTARFKNSPVPYFINLLNK